MTREPTTDDQAAQWLIAQEEGLDAAGQRAFEGWLAASDRNRAAYWRLKHCWREADRITALGPALSPPFHRPAPLRWGARPAMLGIALLLILGAAIGRLLLAGAPDAERVQRFQTDIGVRKTLDFVDGSKVQLNTASMARVSYADDKREFWLDKGEAFFEIAHRKDRPFVVHAGTNDVTVLGTKFAVRRDGGTIRVVVLQGRVRLDEVGRRDAAQSSTIGKGHIALAGPGGMLITARSDEDVENALAWRTGLLKFDRTRLDDVAKEFNRYNRRQLLFADQRAAAIRIGGIFPATRPEAFARLLHDAYALHVEETPDSIKISDGTLQ